MQYYRNLNKEQESETRTNPIKSLVNYGPLSTINGKIGTQNFATI